MKRLACGLLVGMVLVGSTFQAAPPPGQISEPLNPVAASFDAAAIPLIPATQLRPRALHNSGLWSLPITCAAFPPYGNNIGSNHDPETGIPIGYGIFPPGSGNQYLFSSGLWIGGIVDGDTLVSNAYDNQFISIREFWPPNPVVGGVYRTGNYADDEFVAVYTDTVLAPYNVTYNYYDDTSHIPLGLKITQQSYSWKDTLYDNFVIFRFTIENIGGHFIDSAWIGIVVDPDIYCQFGQYLANGWADDASGAIDTFLYDDDPDSRVVIPYAFDMDGDPNSMMAWDELSTYGAVSIALLESPVDEPTCNFNWFIFDGPDRDFGPRRVGTPEDPFRSFAGGYLGTAHRQQDKYYLMAHPEIDYNQMELSAHDSSDGWIPSPISFSETVHDTKFLFSFGPFDLGPDDTAVAAIAFVASESFHVNAQDFINYFNPYTPENFLNRLDFSEIMINHRRVDSVYRSGLTLPVPGPPVGLQVLDHSDDYVTLSWCRSANPQLAGFYVSVKDTVYDNIWRRAHPQAINDTVFTFSVSNPSHVHFFAVSCIDQQGRESGYSFELTVVPAAPHPPRDMAVNLDGMIPALSWQPADDSGLFVYMIYRSIWKEEYRLYDSVSALGYHDYDIESGVKYNYLVTAKNDLQFESEPTGPVSVIPMALDQGVLFYDMNFDASVHVDPYHRRYVDRLVYAVQPLIAMDYYDIENGPLSFKRMSEYSLIVFDSEMRGGKFQSLALDSIRNYLVLGGKALFIVPNASIRDIGILPGLSFYTDGSMFHDRLRLDSAYTNGIVLIGNSVYGDLMGCRSESPAYPELTADMSKLAAAPLPVNGYIPLAGFLYPADGVEYLYRYQSSYPDSILHDQINGVKYIADTGSFIIFNFQLSLMEEPANLVAFRQALTDLGVNLTCGDINDNRFLDIGDAVTLVAYLFRSGPEPDPDRADVNCDGSVNLGDIQVIINAIFKDGAEIKCCP